jgi:hypothetical protein
VQAPHAAVIMLEDDVFYSFGQTLHANIFIISLFSFFSWDGEHRWFRVLSFRASFFYLLCPCLDPPFLNLPDRTGLKF